MTKGKIAALLATLSVLIGIGIIAGRSNPSAADTASAPKPALSVTVIQPAMRDIPMTLTANGSISAWQEAIIGAEVSDLHLTEVNVQVGETVKKGQVLAVFSDESVLADVAQSRAALAEAEANLADARVNAERAQQISASGALSSQQVNQYLTGEKTANAKVQSAKAQLDAQLLRLKYTKVLASDDGVISSRSATLGAIAAKGQELFRMIRQNRLEWRGEVTAAEMAQLKPGMTVSVEVPNVGNINGKIRSLAPTLDVQSRNALAYVDLPDAARHGLRSGMFAKGEFYIGVKAGLTVPQTALSLREGFSYVFKLGKQNGDLSKVSQVKVQLGRRTGDSLEILSGLNPEDRLVAAGSSFLTDGDTVQVVQP
ncbi:MAG: efflux RND transporter periplasmic adaptor subunit [Methylobacter sp.]|jgi:RND family efflux transporter MFP subunit|nr:efflux RND transporter periplasmic adaptor subunit [Methylobacter sp.]